MKKSTSLFFIAFLINLYYNSLSGQCNIVTGSPGIDFYHSSCNGLTFQTLISINNFIGRGCSGINYFSELTNAQFTGPYQESTSATVPNSRGFGIGDRLNGGNKGIWSEMIPNPSSIFLADLKTFPKYSAVEFLTMAGYFNSKSGIGLRVTSEGIFQQTTGAFSIGVVGRRIPTEAAVTSIGVYGGSEGKVERAGVLGFADSINTSLAIGVRGITKGDGTQWGIYCEDISQCLLEKVLMH